MNHRGFRHGAARRAVGPALVIVACAARAAFGAGAEIRIVHHPPAAAAEGVELALDATLAGGSVRSGEIRYRAPGGDWATIPLHPAGDHWSAAIPASVVRPPSIEYYLRMESVSGDQRTDPPVDPETHPYLVPVTPAPGRMTVVSPAPDEPIPPDVGPILAIFDPPLPSAEGILVLLDRRDVTAASEITPDYILFAPPDSIAAGAHLLRVFYADENGATAEARWPFVVTAPGEAVTAEIPAAPPSRFELRGRVEGGWALVRARTDSADVALPYPERSGVLVNAATYGRLGARDVSFSVNRNPLYEAETRISARLAGPRDMIEAGDVLPYLSDEALAWLAARGAWGEIRRGPATSRLVFLRTARAGIANGVASYNQYLVGGSQVLTAGPGSATFTMVHTFDKAGSLPGVAPGEPPPVTGPAITNTVWVLEEALETSRHRLKASLSWSRQDSDHQERRAFAYRLGVAADGPRLDYALEFRSRRPGFLALGAPALNSGEEGLFLDAGLHASRAWDAGLHLETYRDYETNQPLEGHRPVVDASLHVNASAARESRAITPFFIARLTTVPYVTTPPEGGIASTPYRSIFASAGADIGQGVLTGASAVSYTLTHYSGTSRLWTGNGSLWYRPPGRSYDLRIRARLDRGRSGDGSEDYWRPGLGTDVGCRLGRIECRASWEYLTRRSGPRPASNYTENLLSFTAGRAFSTARTPAGVSRNPAAAGGL